MEVQFQSCSAGLRGSALVAGKSRTELRITRSYLFHAFFICVLKIKSLQGKAKVCYKSAKLCLALLLKENKYLFFGSHG